MTSKCAVYTYEDLDLIQYIAYCRYECRCLSYCTMQREMLSKKEVDWINSYHITVWEALSPLLGDSDEHKLTRLWLRDATTPF